MCKFLHLAVFKRGAMLIVVLLLMFIPVNRMILGKITKTDHSLSLNALYPNLNFSTFLGGNLDEISGGIAVSADGSCYVTGLTRSDNFPTLNAYSTYIGRKDYLDAFVSKFTASGYLLWSTYLGGISTDVAEEIAVDSDGNCYVIGDTNSIDFPTLYAYNNTYSESSYDTFISKFSSDGSLLWSTYFGGNDLDMGHGIVVTNDGCYITGDTFSDNLPTINSYDNTIGGERDAFIAKFSTNGSLLWSTYLGGNDWDLGYGITADDAGNCYITGFTRSSNFPILNTNSTYGGNGKYDTFISKFSASGSLLWSTYLGGNDGDYGYAIDIATDGSCYVTGKTSSSNFLTLNAYNNSYGGVGDTFISKFNTNGSLLWSTFLGGNEDDYGYGIAVAVDGSCYVTGKTCSNNFPTLNALKSLYYGGANDIFMSKFSTSGSLLWSTYFGGINDDCGMDISITDDGSCYLSGYTFSNDFPILNAYISTLGSVWSDAFVTKFTEATTLHNKISAYGFLGFIIFIPILIIIIQKLKKQLPPKIFLKDN